MREKEFLKNRYSAIISASGYIFFIAGFLIVSPLLLLFAYPDETALIWSFILPAVALSLSGFILWSAFRPSRPVVLSVQEGGIIVFLSWSIVILFSALPFVFAQKVDFSRAVFEAVSGWTTTGLSILDVSKTSKLILFWRSLMQLAGGAGLAVIMMSSIMGPAGIGVSSAEGRGDQLVPHVRRSARLVLMIYSVYAVVGVLAYHLAGMTVFDSVNHSFAAISTGGFSTRAENIGYWNSVAVEAVSIPLMILGNLSFVTAWYLWRGRLKSVIRNGEVRLMAFLLPLSVALVFVFTCRALYPHLGKALRVSIFETVSALTTTGFSTVFYTNWNSFGIFILIIMMLIGGGTCSTAGGIKQFRVYFLWRQTVWEIKRLLLPGSSVSERPVWEGENKVFVDDSRARQISVFIFIYLATYAVGTAILCCCGYSLQDSMFEFASAIGTVGLSIGVTLPTMPDAALWAETLAMFLGRLEFIVIFVSIIKIAADGRRMIKSER